MTTWLVTLSLRHCGTCRVHTILGSLCPQLSALVSLCSGGFVPCVPRPALSFPRDEGSLCMAKQGRGQGSHHGCTWPCPEHSDTGKVGLHIWAAMGTSAPHHSPKGHKAAEHCAGNTPFHPHLHPVLSIHPITTIPPHSVPSCPILQHGSLLLEAACSYVFCCCSSASQISAELPKNACFGQTPALNKQTRAQKRHWVQGQIVNNAASPSALPWHGEPCRVLRNWEVSWYPTGLPRPPQASPAPASPRTPTHGTGGLVHPPHSARLGGDMARTQHTRTHQLLLSQEELILAQTQTVDGATGSRG